MLPFSISSKARRIDSIKSGDPFISLRRLRASRSCSLEATGSFTPLVLSLLPRAQHGLLVSTETAKVDVGGRRLLRAMDRREFVISGDRSNFVDARSIETLRFLIKNGTLNWLDTRRLCRPLMHSYATRRTEVPFLLLICLVLTHIGASTEVLSGHRL